MMPAWYQRMNPRERVLAWAAAGTVFALLNFFILDWVFGALATAQKQIATRRATLAEQTLYVKERELWTKRDEWIRQHQPTLKNPAEASALLDQLKEVAGKYNVLIENPAIGSGKQRRITRRFLLPLKQRVRGRLWFIFFMMCSDRTLSSCLKVLISRLMAAIQR